MPKHTFKETTQIKDKVFFAGDAELSEADAKALESINEEEKEIETEETEEVSRRGKGRK